MKEDKKEKKKLTIAELTEKRLKKIEKIAELKKEIVELSHLINAEMTKKDLYGFGKGGEK